MSARSRANPWWSRPDDFERKCAEQAWNYEELRLYHHPTDAEYMAIPLDAFWQFRQEVEALYRNLHEMHAPNLRYSP